MELLGDATLVTVRAGGALCAVKAPKDFRAGIGSPVGFAIKAANCHLFDSGTGVRLEFTPSSTAANMRFTAQDQPRP